MRWIRAHKFLACIFGTVFVLCVLIVLSYLSEGSTSPIGRQIERATAFVQRPAALAAFEIRDGVFMFRHVLEENEELRQENAELRAELNANRLTERDLAELRELANILNHDIMSYIHRVVTATIISFDGTNWFNVFTIDRGTDDGVYTNAVVINGDGLVGIVLEAGRSSSKVIGLIDTTTRVSFIVARDPDLIGILYGDGSGALEGMMLGDHAGVVVGDVLLTSGMAMFPRGIEIGRVTSVSYNMDTMLKTVTVEPSVSFGTLRKVAVIL